MIIGIDAGTSVVKAAAFTNEGKNLAVEGRQVKLYNPRPEYSEQDVEETLQAVGEVVRRIVECSEESIDMIGITGQGDGLWLLDEKGHSVRPGITWLDARANSIVEHWMSSGVFEAHFHKNGNVMFPGCHAPLMSFLAQSEPESLDRASTAAYCKDVILQRLTGERATDASDTSLPFIDLESRQYDTEILELLELEAYESLLAPIDPSPGPLRPLNKAGAELLNLAEGTPVYNGPFDVPATAVGAGVDQIGEGVIILGTTLACEVLTDRVHAGDEPGGMTLCALEENRWLRTMPAMVGTASLDLTLSLIGAKHEQLEGFLADSKPGARGVSTLPFFSSSGERAPFVEPAARGRLDGMTLQTTRSDVVRAVCEGVAYAARHCLEAAGLDGELSICGGGAESEAWRQILADVLQQPLKIARGPEVGARGTAMAALIASDHDLDHAAWTRAEEFVQPRRETASLYEEGFMAYLNRVKVARESWGTAAESSASQ